MREYLPVSALLFLVTPLSVDTPRTREEIEGFMRTAKVVARRDTSSGVTHPAALDAVGRRSPGNQDMFR